MFEFTDERMHDLEQVNKDVNHSVQYVTDMQDYGQQEYWAVAGTKGDCEDYALKKLKLLRDRGFPKENLNIAVCIMEGEGHAVLVASFDDNHSDLVLDNNFDEVKPWQQCHVKWIEISTAGDFEDWHKIAT